MGGLSNPDAYARSAERLDPLFSLEVYEELHHLTPPHRVEPERLATAISIGLLPTPVALFSTPDGSHRVATMWREPR